MLHTKIVLNFPNSSNQIKAELKEPINKISAVLQNTSTMMNVIASGLSNSGNLKYVSIESIFTFISNEVLTNAIKSIAIDNTITFDTPKANAVISKNIDNLTSDIVLSSLLIASIELTFEVSQELDLNSNLLLGLSKTIEIDDQINIVNEINFILNKWCKIAHQIGISSEVNFFLSKWVQIQSNFQFEVNNPNGVLSKQISAENNIGFNDNVLYLSSQKYLKNNVFQFEFGSSANAIVSSVVERFRTWFDIDNFSLGEIDNWTMAEFDII